MADSPLLNTEGPVSIEVRSDGAPVPDTFEIFSVRTRSEFNRVSEAIIVVGDGDPSSRQFPVADGAQFKPGTPIEVKAGYANRTKTIFKGVVTAVRLRVDSVQTSRLEITCRHKASVLLQGRRRAVYPAEKKDSDLIQQTISDAGLSVKIKPTKVTLQETVRVDVSDWDFILSRAEKNGMLIMCTDEGLSVAKPDFVASALLEVSYGEDLISIDMEVSARGQFEGFEASAWDPAKQSIESQNATSDSDNKYGNLTATALAKVLGPEDLRINSSAFHDGAALTAYVDARASRADLALAQGWVVFQGSAVPQPNSVLRLKGLGKRFSGDGLVGGVVHRIEAGSWTTEVQLGLPAGWASDQAGFEAPAASAMATATRGLVIGKVTQLDGDPAGLSRIQVAVPEFDGGAIPVWARLGSSYATNAAGLMFLPEVDDEVVIGFLNDDPSCPIVLGSLHSPKLVPPEGFKEYDKENNTKAIISREQLKIVFDEDNKILSLETPGGNKIKFDDDAGLIELTDQNENKITMDSSGIVLDGSSDIEIKAKGNVEVKAGGSVKISGSEISANGSSSFKASGGSSAELTAGGTIKVAGSLVQIN